MQTTTLNASVGNKNNTDYQNFLVLLNVRFHETVGSANLFTTDLDLWPVYLDNFSPELRQEHNCHACRQFIQRFGGLVTIDELGKIKSAVWDENDAPEEYKSSVQAMRLTIERRRVSGVFVSSEKVYGTPKTGDWVHLSLRAPAHLISVTKLYQPHQVIASKLENFKTVSHALSLYSSANLEIAVKLLKTDSLYRSEKLLGQAEWLLNLRNSINRHSLRYRDNIIWLAVASAPEGLCHPRSGMIGTLLDDIAARYEFNELARRFADKMRPDVYQRPQTPPSAGTVNQAEEIFKKLGAEKSLERRFAKLEDLTHTLWLPKAEAAKPDETGIFASLVVKGQEKPKDMAIPPIRVTFSKFARDVLPDADTIKLLTPQVGSYTSLLTAVHKDSPPIIQWDNGAYRNHVSWYVWRNGCHANQFGLAGGSWVDLTAITLKPNMWTGDYRNHGVGAVFIIKGAAEKNPPSMCLFPEILRSEFHPVRAVIEAYSQSKSPAGFDEQSAAGLMVQPNAGDHTLVNLRVVSKGSTVDYIVDRWE